MRNRIIEIPFSSSKFLFNEGNFGAVFHAVNEPMVLRQKNIRQLQGLTHPLTSGCESQQGCFWYVFPHTRFDHAIRIPPLAKIILEKHGYDDKEVQQFLLTMLTHDIATPAVGDSTMRLNKDDLCEVKNYSRFMNETGLGEKLCREYGFDVGRAQACVNGEGVDGILGKCLDWHSYTALDAFHLGKEKPVEVQRLLKKYPRAMDVWQDICIANGQVFFSDTQRLFQFLKLRALMCSQLYYNPDCRKLEHLFFQEIKRLFEKGEFSLDDLRYRDDQWLNAIVRDGKDSTWCTQPHKFFWKRFEDEQELNLFCENNDNVFHTEFIKPFKTGSNWNVSYDGKIMPLVEALSKKQSDDLEKLSKLREGWYVYMHK